MACLDTTFLLDLLGRGGRAVQNRALGMIRELGSLDEHLTTTMINLAELHVGVNRALEPEAERRRIDRVLRGVSVLPFDRRAAAMFGVVKAELGRIGKPAGDMDVLIAAVAIVNGHTILTRNARHFSRIPGLTVISY